MPEFEAIVIGGSWGGMDTSVKILGDLPRNFPLPIILVLHRMRNVPSELTEILDKKMNLRVQEIEDKTPIKPGYVHVAPSNYHVLIEEERCFSLSIDDLVHYSRPSIDVLFESASDVFKNKLLAIILTGANSDGSDGMHKVKQNGGFTVVQEPEDAECAVMPLAALNKVKVDKVMRKDEINSFLKSIIHAA